MHWFNKNKWFAIELLTALLLIFTFSCANYYLRTERIEDIKETGDVSLILYGHTYSTDPETLAVIDPEGDEYTFTPYASEYKYKVIHGLSPAKAIQDANFFVKGHPYASGSIMKRILNEQGTVIGYEIRPLYHFIHYGLSDILDVSYRIRENKVSFFVDIKRSIQKRLFRDELGVN